MRYRCYAHGLQEPQKYPTGEVNPNILCPVCSERMEGDLIYSNRLFAAASMAMQAELMNRSENWPNSDLGDLAKRSVACAIALVAEIERNGG